MDRIDFLFREFEEEIKHKNRFIINSEIIELFYKIINENTIDIKKGTILYRGRINEGHNIKPYPRKEIGMPNPKTKLTVGRINPYGINYMYLAEDVETVVHELRPNLNDYITIGEFELVNDIRLVQLSNFAVSSDCELSELAFKLGRRFAKPVNKNNDMLDYLPTQYFAELCKNNKGTKLDGVKYLSSVMHNTPRTAKEIIDGISGRHYNIALFDDKVTNLKKKRVIQVSGINYDYRSANNANRIK